MFVVTVCVKGVYCPLVGHGRTYRLQRNMQCCSWRCNVVNTLFYGSVIFNKFRNNFRQKTPELVLIIK